MKPLLLLPLLFSLQPAEPVKGSYSQDRAYPYAGKTFDSFVNESFRVAGKGSSKDFYRWFDQRLTGVQGASWNRWIKTHTKAARTKPVGTAQELHRLVKKTIPKFSLDRGFEFSYTVSRGERQCFLQSVLIAGIFQKMKMNAGVAMVYRNIAGDPSYIGHAVTVLRLPSGRDLLVDASEPMASPRHMGLFLYDEARSCYQFVEPRYQGNQIVSYRRAEDGSTLPVAQAKWLDNPFLRSQFDYYRGERTVGGIFASKPTPEGLKVSARFLEKSRRECPNNPLAVYMLGRTYAKLGKESEERECFSQAMTLCQEFGWVPEGLRSAFNAKP